jgi:hypothetical protein
MFNSTTRTHPAAQGSITGTTPLHESIHKKKLPVIKMPTKFVGI